jgi:hypothetical protein
MSTAQLTLVTIEPASSAASRYRLDERTRELGQVGLASARAILAAAAARREAAAAEHAQAA